jgi:hypothetical protein
LPNSIQAAPRFLVSAPPHSADIARQVQDWKTTSNPIDAHSISPHKPPPDVDVIIVRPPVEDSTLIALRLLSSPIPFALLLPAELVPQILTTPSTTPVPDLPQKIKQCGKLFILDTDMIWIIGNIPTLHNHAEIFSLLMDRPSPLLEHYPLTTHLPQTLKEWAVAQQDDPDLLAHIDPATTFSRDTLSLFHDPDFPSRIIVPIPPDPADTQTPR